jgi:hypothetical protein
MTPIISSQIKPRINKKIDMSHPWIVPDWPAPSNIIACTTTRQGGFSSPPFDGLNLGDHVGDDIARVVKNRKHLKQQLELTQAPFWLQQTHSTLVVEAKPHPQIPVEADGSFCRNPGSVCAVLTADCLPVLICDRQGTSVAAVHAGWRGLAAGIIENAIRLIALPTSQLLVWLGPAIGPGQFEVGNDVREVFVSTHADTDNAFVLQPNGRYLADLYQIARTRLAKVGVTAVYGGGLCTYTEADRFFSYRREKVTGRMASLISIQSNS